VIPSRFIHDWSVVRFNRDEQLRRADRRGSSSPRSRRARCGRARVP
jgi:hypothetical protein